VGFAPCAYYLPTAYRLVSKALSIILFLFVQHRYCQWALGLLLTTYCLLLTLHSFDYQFVFVCPALLLSVGFGACCLLTTAHHLLSAALTINFVFVCPALLLSMGFLPAVFYLLLSTYSPQL
jgi:hypothetical protein